ncbi:hypothetical protein IFM89_031869 [Coptis chinensis]|uniref:DOG1 domain-containing protein n=1 Tax=Coptis chinensis TaxID=261450 RepID=A0A835LFR8_9MAGN|nr:hypothetical protein IFM89_031869 [Coptis chinensis]
MQSQVQEKFSEYYERWISLQEANIYQLLSVSRDSENEQEHKSLVSKVLNLHKEYYTMKWAGAHNDVLGSSLANLSEEQLKKIEKLKLKTRLEEEKLDREVERQQVSVADRKIVELARLSGHVREHLERSVEANRLVDIAVNTLLADFWIFFKEIELEDLGDLSPAQLARVSELQCETVRKENEITTELGSWQESACDIVSLLLDQEPEVERLVKVLEKADDLRLKTIKSVVEVLTPQQAVEFLIAAAELQFGVRGWGLAIDQRRGNT